MGSIGDAGETMKQTSQGRSTPWPALTAALQIVIPCYPVPAAKGRALSLDTAVGGCCLASAEAGAGGGCCCA